MVRNFKIVVVIPCYRVKKFIKNVIESIPEFVDEIIVVDDECPEGSGKYIESLNFSNVHVIFHERNLGVGGAFLSGCKKALELNADVVVKIDGDGQMDLLYLDALIAPIFDSKADYVKGNRFKMFDLLTNMPKIRLLGNSLLSFFIKGASGYWNISDPTNGYIAMKSDVLKKLDLDKIDKGYYFEIDMLINIYLKDVVVEDVPVPTIYGDEESSLSIMKVLKEFPGKILKGFFKRIFFKYFILDFNMASVYMVIGSLLLIAGMVFGSYEWYKSILLNRLTPTGTVMLPSLSIILGVEFLLQAINIDINNIPKKDDKK